MIFNRLRNNLVVIFIVVFLCFPAGVYAANMYDLCYRVHKLNAGKILFLRYRYPLEEAIFRSYEIYVFDPVTSNLSFPQEYREKIYIPPVISRDRTTISYHCLVEGSDYLVTANLELGKRICLGFDTGGYFTNISLDYDNDTAAAVIKRGPGKQAIYLISNRKGTMNRVLNGVNFEKVGFLDNGSIFYIEKKEGTTLLGITRRTGKNNWVVAEDVDYIKKAPNGDAII
ncbi:MAG: hypothetical protein ACOC7U_06170, partial [Spirochaetota bacterium]